MSTESATRLNRLKLLRAHAIDPYPGTVVRTHTIADALKSFDDLTRQPASIVGRVRAIRSHGKSCFIDLEDGSGKIQLYLAQRGAKPGIGTASMQSDTGIEESVYALFMETLDVADFIETSGTLFMTKTSEPTLRVSACRIITKSLEPLPEKWHGLQDVELRYRNRYLDLIMNDESRSIALQRISLTRALRMFFDVRGFFEVETPILQPLAGGATARPFVTHHHALDEDFFLRIAPELYLKRLVVGGFEKVYEIARCFRNEGIDRAHNPEFTQLEFYWAYAGYEDLMALTEELFAFLLKDVKGSTMLSLNGKQVDCAPPYPRLTFQDALEVHAGIKDAIHMDALELSAVAKKNRIDVEKGWRRGRLLDELWKHLVRPAIISPVFLIDHPIELSPLAKRKSGRPDCAERFQLIINGFEVVNAFTELNDPIDQEQRFREQEMAREAGDEEAQRYDEDFISALRHGMPPTAGWGMGIDRVASLFTGTHNLKEVILFPTLRPTHPPLRFSLAKGETNGPPLKKGSERDEKPTAWLRAVETGDTIDKALASPGKDEGGSVSFPREKALILLRTHINNENLIKHMLAVEAVMRKLAEKFEEDADQWGLAGLLHDIDWEETQNDFSQHSLVSARYLDEVGIDSSVVQAIRVHNHTHGFPLTNNMEKALYSAEELTGLIAACALVQPSKKLKEVTVDSVLKKFKQSSFAKGVNREVILQSEDLLGMTLTELTKLELEAMQGIADQLGL